jgi:predicted permease
LSGVAALVLLICCANVAGLMMARASGMTKEMGIRISIGASRLRIARLLLFESAVLAAISAGIALLITKWLADLAISALSTVPVMLNLDFNIDTRVILFTTAIATLAAVAFGAVPALRASRADSATVLKSTSSPVSVGGRKVSFRSILVGMQVAASIVMLVTAMLFLRSMKSAFDADLGLDIRNVALMTLEPEPGYSPSDADALRDATLITDALAQTASVKHVTWSDNAPLAFDSNRRGTSIEGYQKKSGEDLEFHFNSVGPSFLSTMGIPVVKGRDLTAQDRDGAPAVAVVNERFANRFWPGANPIGKRISFDGDHWKTIVGVARDAHLVSMGTGEIQPHIFVPMLQDGWRGTEIAVKTDNLTNDKLKTLKGIVQKAAPRWFVRNERTLAKQAQQGILPQRIASTVLSLFGGFALFLAAVGLYGVIAYAVTQRQSEFGIRFALGATPQDVLRMMLGQGLRVVFIGAVAGLIVTAGAAQLLKSLLLGLSPLDPVSFIAAPLFLVGVSTLATLMPARRAARVDPLKALRAE